MPVTGARKYREGCRRQAERRAAQPGGRWPTWTAAPYVRKNGAQEKWGTCEMGAGIAANPHYPVLPRALPPRFIPFRFSCDQRPAKRNLRRDPEQSGDGLVGPLSGAGRTWKALHHLFLRLPKHSLSKRWTAFPVPDRVHLNSWESRCSVTRLSTDFFVNPSVSFRLVLQPPLVSRGSDVSVVR